MSDGPASSTSVPKTYHLLRISSGGLSVPPPAQPAPVLRTSVSQSAFARPLPTNFSVKRRSRQARPHSYPILRRRYHGDMMDKEQLPMPLKRPSPTGKLDVYEATGLKPLVVSPSKSKNNGKGKRQFKQARSSLEDEYRAGHRGSDSSDDSDDELKEKQMEPFFAAMKDPRPSVAFIPPIPPRLLDFDHLVEEEKIEDDRFEILPDEMVLKVFSFLPKFSLGRCTMVSTRFKRLATDETLWKRTDLPGKCINAETLVTILTRKPIYLRLARSLIPNLPATFTDMQSQLIYLDLSMAVISKEGLAAILKRCNRLVKLSLEHLVVGKEALIALAAGHDLETLNLTMCYDLDCGALEKMLTSNKKIKDLNLGCVKQNWTKIELCRVICSLPKGLLNLNFSGFRSTLCDSHVQVLVEQIPSVIDLDLSDSQELTGASVLNIITHLKEIQRLSLSRCYSIEPEIYTNLNAIPSLRHLEVFSLFKEISLKALKAAMPATHINCIPFSVTARPTVGNRRSSIWGQRVRD